MSRYYLENKEFLSQLTEKELSVMKDYEEVKNKLLTLEKEHDEQWKQNEIIREQKFREAEYDVYMFGDQASKENIKFFEENKEYFGYLAMDEKDEGENDTDSFEAIFGKYYKHIALEGKIKIELANPADFQNKEK